MVAPGSAGWSLPAWADYDAAGRDDAEDDRVLQDMAAGPLEGFLGRFDAEVIDRVEAEAARDPRFRRVLSGVWKHGMTDPVRARARAIQATVPDPLPEMRPLVADEAPRPDREGR